MRQSLKKIKRKLLLKIYQDPIANSENANHFLIMIKCLDYKSWLIIRNGFSILVAKAWSKTWIT